MSAFSKKLTMGAAAEAAAAEAAAAAAVAEVAARSYTPQSMGIWPRRAKSWGILRESVLGGSYLGLTVALFGWRGFDQGSLFVWVRKWHKHSSQ